jgi:hypothetical protein
MYLAPVLSHHSFAIEGHVISISRIKVCIHIISIVELAADLYSAFVLDRETIFYFLALRDTRFIPKNRAYPPVDSLSSSDLAQCISDNLLTSSDLHFVIFKPSRVVCFIYLRIPFNCSPVYSSWRIQKLT